METWMADASQTQETRSLEPCRELSGDEALGVVARNFIGVLSTVGDGHPYAIPFIYGFDDGAFFAVLSPGRKARNIEANANVCVTIVEGEDGGPWRSAIATGKASWVEGVLKLGHALNTIRKQYPGNPMRSAPGLSALKGYHVLRVDVEELTGCEQE
jgi:nitroimidazol reductase NimA-like FMN-containing flavoprotein (pyridoxamine 5'-phosphate oxidase superfamily)